MPKRGRNRDAKKIKEQGPERNPRHLPDQNHEGPGYGITENYYGVYGGGTQATSATVVNNEAATRTYDAFRGPSDPGSVNPIRMATPTSDDLLFDRAIEARVIMEEARESRRETFHEAMEVIGLPVRSSGTFTLDPTSDPE
jgi:hypothetical protein